MPENKLVVVHDAVSDQLTVELHFHEILSAEPVSYEMPLDLRERALLRWYLEEYLSFPVGAEEDRARGVERLLPEWGARLFETLFGVGSPGRDFYIHVRNRGFDRFKFEVRYTSGTIRNVPWELLYDPQKEFFLVHQFAAFSRRQVSKDTTIYEPRAAGEELRLLVVTARPYKLGQDVPYRTVTGPMMEVLRHPSLRDRIYIEMLRPPTFEAFQKAIKRKNDKGQSFFDVVHFDGHGGFGLPDPDEISEEPLRVLDLFKGPAGVLVFETPEGTEDRIEVDLLKKVVGEHRVPLVVLNACRSGMEALEDPQTAALIEMLRQSPEAQTELARLTADDAVDLKALLAGQGDKVHSMASAILEGGASAVVSMGFIVRAKAAAVFMRGFYGALLEGGSAAAAVSAGRVALMLDSERPTQFGELPLEDWMVPVYSERFDLRLFAKPQIGTQLGGRLREPKDEVANTIDPNGKEKSSLPQQPRFGFIGRDREILMIERALLDPNLAGLSLVGLGGNGKTALAVGTARWMMATHAPQVAGGVFFHQFLERDEAGNALHPNLAALLRTVECELFSDDVLADESSERTETEQETAVTQYLKTTPCLLVLDNMETAAGLGEAPALLSKEERTGFVTFLREVCVPNGSTRVLVTSRREEPWLGLNLAHLEVGGLDREAAEELAQQVLLQSMEAVDLDSKRRNSAWSEGYQQLLRTLGGHPMALQIVLPHLAQRTPDEILTAYSEGSASIDGELSGPTDDRERTLRGSLDFSISTLSERTRRLLPFLAFFREWVNPNYLTIACLDRDSPERLRGVDAETWMNTLLELQSTGLVTRLSEQPRSPFTLHSLLPWHLMSELEATEDAEALEARFRQFSTDFAISIHHSFWTGGGAAQTIPLFRKNAGVLRHALHLALRREQLEQVMPLYQCLHDLMLHSGQIRQAAQLVEALIEELRSNYRLDDSQSIANRVWTDLQLKRAHILLNHRKLPERAEKIYQEIKDTPGRSDREAAAALHQLGTAACERRDFEEARRLYRASLNLSSGKILSYAAASHHQLGFIAQELRDFVEAEQEYKKSLTIRLQVGDESGAAISQHQLGRLAEERKDYGEAELRYEESLELNLKIGNTSAAAKTYHQLGMLAERMRDLDRAEQLYRKSLEFKVKSDDQSNIANSYHHLGSVAQERGRLAEAERWYEKSINLKRKLGSNRHAIALTQAQMGITKLLSGRAKSGTDLLIGAIKEFESTNDPRGFTRNVGNLRVAVQDGLVDRPLVETLWQQHFEAPIPDDIAEVLFADDDDPPTERPSLPDEARQALVGMLQMGLSMKQVVEALERGSGQRFAPEAIEWLQAEMAVDEDREEDETE